MVFPRFVVTLPSESRMLSVARGFVETACQQFGLDRAVMHSIVLATGEAFTNVIRHAHREKPDAQIEILCEIQSDAVVLVFQDEGEPFDLAAVPHLAPGELRIGGRGVFLLRQLMDELTCAPRGEGKPGNVLRMVKRLPEAAAKRCG
jgi:serine/threonine-protein kinase RsbW